MKLRYVRFGRSVMRPGPAGVSVDAVRLPSPADGKTNSLVRAEALMDEIDADFERRIVVLRATAKLPSGKHRQFRRIVPFENCTDMEPLDDEAEEAPRKGPRQ